MSKRVTPQRRSTTHTEWRGAPVGGASVPGSMGSPQSTQSCWDSSSVASGPASWVFSRGVWVGLGWSDGLGIPRNYYLLYYSFGRKVRPQRDASRFYAGGTSTSTDGRRRVASGRTHGRRPDLDWDHRDSTTRESPFCCRRRGRCELVHHRKSGCVAPAQRLFALEKQARSEHTHGYATH